MSSPRSFPLTRARAGLALATSLLAVALVLGLPLAPAHAGSGRGTLYAVTSLGGSPPSYRITVNSTAAVTVGDHVMGKVAGGLTGVWLVTAKTATTIDVQDSLTEANAATAFGAPAAGGADSVFAFATPAANGTTPIPDGASHWTAALRRNTYLAATSASSTGAALTRTNDTNVTLALGGSPSTALLNAASLTLGWTGTLAESRGGTGASSLTAAIDSAFGSTRGSVLYRGASGWVVLTPGTSGHALVSNGAGADPSYQSVTSPTPTLAQVLAAGANGNAVDQTNLGSLTTAAGETVTSPTVLASTALVVGSADTSGIRLDLSGGTLELREGDDSNYANLIGNSIVSVSARGTTNLAVGTVDTNGIRLDLETGTLAVREGDDSAYAPLAANSLTLATPLTAANGGTGSTSLSAGIDAAFGSTRGSVLYRGASGWTSLAPGTSGYALTSNGVGADPSYQAPTAATLAAVLAAGADGNAVTVTNLGHLGLGESAGVGKRLTHTYAGNGVSVWASNNRSLTYGTESGGNLSNLTINYTGAPVSLQSTTGGMTINATGVLSLNAGSSSDLSMSTPAKATVATTDGFRFDQFVMRSITDGTGSPATLGSDDEGARINNSGTTVKAACTLPAAAAGLHFFFDVVDDDGLRINAASGDTIRLGDTTCASAGYFESVRIGSSVHLVAVDADNWVAVDGITGTWRADSPTSAGFAYTPTTWTTWTSPTTTWVSNVTWTGVYRQIGSDLELKLGGAVTGAPTSAALQVDLPAGYTATVETGDNPTSFGPRSFGIIYDTSASARYAPLQGTWADSNTLTISYTAATSTISSVTQAAPVTFATGDYVLFYATVRLD